ncbi:putative Integrase [Vibrio nigripulchritudo SFn27]|uniref:Putative Integrase n=1 Tax=Vibrio nigripulchritudo TaxID=28173 RepID=U4KBJ2_9VIBR|nr:integrase [Vibrio nigripulchritudo]CCN84347.1 putative Integrase [Vibrio nigripulchritudo BLFn1]CCN87136.1 putative Integrase [Vibrio nigripulchritudo SFn27]CCN93328.1 putative Integrase [Vibrio nigripulchritudo ENn2]CCO50404.1 putative Integrase [Vibrio nigripulchritudo Wn13]CCO57717.1 putative Integrase [Vibrio nigripulchritudo]
MVGRKRTRELTHLPKYLYRETKDGKTRYRFTLVDGSRVLLPEKFTVQEIITAANAYNAEYRPEHTLQFHHRRKPKDSFDRLLSDWLDVVEKRIISEEDLSSSILTETKSDIEKLRVDLGTVYSKSLTLAMMNDFLTRHYGDKSKEVYNKKLGRLKKIFAYLADESAIESNILLNKKSKKLNARDKEKKRLDLKLEDFKAIESAAPLFLKVAMKLSIQSTHAVKELHRIKYRIKVPKPNLCGILWFQEPINIDNTLVYGTLYIHRAKSANAKTSYVAIPVTQGIKDAVDLSRTSRLHCPYIVHRKPKQDNGISKECDHRYQVTRKTISRTFSKVRDELGLYADIDKSLRPTFHEIRGLAARLFSAAGENPRQRMAHSSDSVTKIYIDGNDVEWHEVAPVNILL